MEKFKIGDRVVCIEGCKHIQVGDTGTVLENSVFPFIAWDKYNEDNHHSDFNENYWSVCEDYLEITSRDNINYEIY